MIGQNLKNASRDSDQAPFRDGLSSVGYDIFSTCVQKLTILAFKPFHRYRWEPHNLQWSRDPKHTSFKGHLSSVCSELT